MTTPFERFSAALADRYVIERELGAGGMATVYLAADLKHKRHVALKVLKPELAAVLGADRFLQEIATTASLQHPHILPLFDSGTADGFLFYVMPFIEGETLRDKLNRETQFGIDEAVRIAREVADALEYAHQHGIVHRDIKPENILLQGGHAVVADFGIALAVSAAAGGRMTETGLSLGTPHYMSPEQATADKDITARSDVYSLGSVLFEMLAGQPPYLGGSAQQIIMKIIAEPAESVAKLRKSVPPNVAAAVATSLEKLPADRFESAAQFASALVNPSYGIDAANAAHGGGPALALRGIGRRTMAFVGVVALAVGVGATKVLWRERPAPVRTSRMMLAFPANQEPRYASLQNTPILTQLPDGNGLIYWGPGTSTRAQLMLRSWDRLAAVRMPQAVDEGCCVVLSPRGDSVAYLVGPHSLVVVPFGGGTPLAIADSGLTSVTDFGGGIDWAPDGWVYASSVTGLMRVRSQGGTTEPVAALDGKRGDGRYMWPSVLPGSRAALVTVVPLRDALDGSRWSVGVADFKSGKVDILMQGLRAVYSPTGHLIVAKSNGTLWAVPFDPESRRLLGRERELPDTVDARRGHVDLSLSPTGTLAYTKGVVHSFHPVWVERTGEMRPIAPDLLDPGASDPALSPDGKLLMVVLAGADFKNNLWLKPLAGGPKSRFTFDGSNNLRAAWRPGTGAVSFSSNRETLIRLALFERNVNGSGDVRKLNVREQRQIVNHVWSADGKWLVYRTDDQEAGNADIMGIRLGVDTVPRPLVATPAEELAPSLSYDGRWIAYTSNESGRREVYVRPFPETGGGRFQVSATGGTNPVWSRDGREIFYIDAATNVVAAPIIPGPTFQFGSPQVLFSAAQYLLNPFGRQYDVTADGKRFVMIRSVNDAAVHVVVVFNFVDELRQRMAKP